MDGSGSLNSTAHNKEGKPLIKQEEMQIDTEPASSSGPPPRVPSPMITVTDQDAAPVTTAPATAAPAVTRQLTPTRERKKSPATGVSPRQRKRSQPVRGELLPDPDKLLSYKHHDKKDDEVLEDPTFPGGLPKPPPEPRAPGQPAERKRSNVTFCPVVQTIEK